MQINKLDSLLLAGATSFYECLLYYHKTKNLDRFELILRALVTIDSNDISSQSLENQDKLLYAFPDSNDDVESLESLYNMLQSLPTTPATPDPSLLPYEPQEPF